MPRIYFGKTEVRDALMKMAAQCLSYFVLVFVVDFKLCWTFRYKYLPSANVEHLKATSGVESTEPLDDDVLAEDRRIQYTSVHDLYEENPIIVKGVSKVYDGRTLAVDNINLGLADNQCFGLLGQNGAGKTTTFKMLTGNLAMSRGDIYFLGQDLKTSLNSIMEHIGYCPQSNALNYSLTGRETLYLYGRLRGIPEEHLDNVTTQLMEHLTITSHADVLTRFYSGGTKRKLSVGISLIGNPDFILLDEPMAGNRPSITEKHLGPSSSARKAGKTIIISSHSMEDCEALCTRLAIMMTGRFRCIGSLQHLKNKFVQGVAIFVKMTPKVKRAEFMDYITQSFTDVAVIEDKPRYVHLLVPGKDIKWSAVYQTMETTRQRFDVPKFSVQRTTLEQIFLMFVQGANPPIRRKGSCQQNMCLECRE